MSFSSDFRVLATEFDQLVLRSKEDAKVLNRLAACLDRLSALASTVPDVSQNLDDREPPETEFRSLYDCIGSNYPGLGYYAAVLDYDPTKQEIGIGDAIDDLADIARDLADVRWYLDQDLEAEALWSFTFGYRTHWGEHLHSVRSIIHERLFGPNGIHPH